MMRKWFLVVSAIALVLPVFFFSVNAQSASVSGTVKFEGTPPPLKKLDLSSDTYCAHAHKDAPLSEVLVLGSGQTIGNIFVRVKSGLGAKTYPAPKEAAVLNQKGCMYTPHVLGVMVGQPLRILNSDEVLHNVHAFPKINREFNLGMPATVKEQKKTFRKAEDFFPIKCDVHPWMNSWLAVMDHPFFSVTKEDGKFKIDGLPAGTYEIEAWHEKMKPQIQKVTVGESDNKVVDFSFSK